MDLLNFYFHSLFVVARFVCFQFRFASFAECFSTGQGAKYNDRIFCAAHLVANPFFKQKFNFFMFI